mmetsp:Transcript_15499/g.13253  ORF Transcript_15499/g.13253 Transcript_15499/m.13253 type:complete len:155 (+) Transcript_15499:547-1011(+)|eukprot:CAMPEP_0114575568 /NCGR_PEP_ID=MMETSP0125-20121206/419_1 /TAXON_ID=485358 ORGANISM="Aristerostoma sp., Strain ATCC 50986" /NCGR_SAMPLE_ID=MMETSP0125 /ASSEMBLY_ACC=CAM_ASM_000245 /LENGTH=154 /DNA_ID=CAMNT_0001763391 /DNA_START=239 /DNA_END=703 /DNA_ORIENTATION=-
MDKDKSLESKFFWINVIKLKRVKPIEVMGSFGEGFLRQVRPIHNTIIASEDTITLTISRENYLEIINTLIGRMQDKVQFFKELFPSLKDDKVSKLAYYFGEVHFERGDSIYTEGDSVDHLLLLKSGDVKLSKTVSLPEDRKLKEKIEKLYINTP